MLALVVKRRADLVRGRVLHFAPEPAITMVIQPSAAEYVTTDIADVADVRADITELPFPADYWDLIICSHVLEHVIDDATAMKELRRVLSPSGHAIIVVPRIAGRPTDEDASVTEPGERLRRFGQDDHVRIYGDDLESRLSAAGFNTIEQISVADFTREQIELFRLQLLNAATGEVLLVCS